MTATIPLATAARTCALVSATMTGADAVCQYLEHRAAAHRAAAPNPGGAFGWDSSRSLRMGFVGLVLSGPVSQVQHVLLERFFPGNATKAVIQKVVGGAVTAPLVLSANFALVGALKGHDRDRIADKVKRDVGPTWLAGTMYWPAVMAVNFRLVPLVHRAVVSGGAGALWNVYLCGQANKDEAEDEEEGSVAAASTPFVATGMDVAPPA